MNTRLRTALAALGMGLALAAQADDAYPTRTIRWIVPYLAGTSPDNTARLVADAMGKALGQTVIIENKPGAGGNLGAQMAARSAPDGYTWVYSGSPMASAMRTYRKPGFDAMKDFVHVGRIGTSDLTVVSYPGSGIASMADLIARGRKEPGRLMFASGGIGSPAHMGAELMLETAGIDATHVPFKGAPESVTAVISRQVDFSLAITSVALPHIQSGKLVPLAVTAPKRNDHLPTVPTLTESGVPVTLVSFGGLSLPTGTPAPIVKRVADALQAALAKPELKAQIDALGGAVAWLGPKEYTEAMRAEIAQTGKLMAAAKLEAQ